MSVALTVKQSEANALLSGPATHCMLFGGSRSGKTFLLCRAISIRALKAEGSRHAILRHRFNHVKSSVWHDTWPKMMRLCWPDIPYKQDKSDWFIELPNGSQVWMGGLDEKERTEKILGQEYCVSPAAKVLAADLAWVEAHALKAGQEIIAFPEELFGNQKLIRSKVESTSVIQAEGFAVLTDRGETIVSGRHAFVVGAPATRRRLKWKTADTLVEGDYIKFATSPWVCADNHEGGWIAGILDGEGCVSGTDTYTNCSIAQNDGAVFDELTRILTSWGINYGVFRNNRGTNSVACRGLWQALRLLGKARPHRLLPKAPLLWEGKRAFNTRDDHHYAKVIGIRPLGMIDVIALGTTSKTLIADGFLGHNSSIYLNECSQISFGAREIVRTRLAQNVGLKLKLYYDENPPMRTHWTHRLFIEKRHVEPPYLQLENPQEYASLLLNPADNAANLPETYLKELQTLGPRAKLRFWEGKFGDASEGALWSFETIERYRVTSHPDLQRIVVSVDPSGTKGEEDDRSDHVGIVIAGLGIDGQAYVLEDLTVKAPPAVWGRVAVTAFQRHYADCIVGETNFGGAMVEHVIKTAASELKVVVPYREVTASRGKIVRAEPASSLYEQGKIHHVGAFPELEDQLASFTTGGYMGDKSPDRADSLIWAIAQLFPGLTRKADKKPLQHMGVAQYSPHRQAYRVGR